jgi:uncharacterized protein DUF6798
MEIPTSPAAGASGPPREGLTWLEGATLALLVAVAGIDLVGYRFGDSNQGITIPILKRFMDSSLYRWDVMVATGERFPTIFYATLAAVLPGKEAIPAAFFALYVVSIAAALAGVYRIGRWCGGAEAGLLALLVAIPVRNGIANESLYRVQFSHSHIASALVIWAMVLFLEGRRVLPLLMLSLGAYNHLLYSVYVLVPCLLVVLVEAREVGRRRTLLRLAAAVLPLLPFAAWTLAHRTPMTPEWLSLLRLRSAHHSFPSYFGDSLAAGAFLLALGTLTLSRLPRPKRVIVALFFAGFAIQFVLGTVFTEFVPLKAVLQFQPHRCWRFLMLILYGLAAAGVVTGWRAGGLARVAAGATAVILVNPQFEPLLPVAVLLQAAVGRPVAETWARLTAVGTLAALAGWDAPHLALSWAEYPLDALTTPTVLGAAALAVLVWIGHEMSPSQRRGAALAAAAATLLWLGPTTYERRRAKWESGAWRDVQDWVRLHTPKDAIFVTPPQEAGFRVFSERTVVGEWKDGTQQYFDEQFANEWAARMQALGPEGYARLSDEQLTQIARRFGASFVVAPLRQRRPGLEERYRNNHYAVYGVPPIGAGGVNTAVDSRRSEAEGGVRRSTFDF